MAFLTAYFDDSGHPASHRVVALGGFVSTTDHWIRFSKEWQGVLKEFDVPYMHMKEYAHSVGPFVGWKGDESKRLEFMKRLIALLKGLPKGSACSVMTEPFNAVNKRYWLREFLGGPYAICARACARHLNDWREFVGIPGSIDFVFDDGSHQKGDLLRLFPVDGWDDPIFRPWRKFPPLQAADIVAWEMHKFEEAAEGGTFKEYRKPFLELFAEFQQDWNTYFLEDDIENLCIENKVPLRKPGVFYKFKNTAFRRES
jgi:hypothetical protein